MTEPTDSRRSQHGRSTSTGPGKIINIDPRTAIVTRMRVTANGERVVEHVPYAEYNAPSGVTDEA